MPSLRKRQRSGKRTIWDIRYQVNGKTRVYTIGETDFRSAQKIFREFCERLAEGKLDNAAVTTEIAIEATAHTNRSTKEKSRIERLSDLARHAKEYAQANKSPRTVEREQHAFLQLIAELGDIPTEELTPARIEVYKSVRLTAVAPATLNVELRTLNTAIHQCVALGMIEERPKSFKQIRIVDPEAPMWPNRDQIDQLLRVCSDDETRFVTFLANTGARRNEALAVCWSDISLDRRQIVLRSQITKTKRRRIIPVNDTLLAMFVGWPGSHEGILFKMFTPNQITMAIRRRCRAAGLPKGISIHSFRAGFASSLIAAGVDLHSVAKLLGHTSIATTEKHYLSMTQAHLSAAVHKLDHTEHPPNEPDDGMK